MKRIHALDSMVLGGLGIVCVIFMVGSITMQPSPPAPPSTNHQQQAVLLGTAFGATSNSSSQAANKSTASKIGDAAEDSSREAHTATATSADLRRYVKSKGTTFTYIKAKKTDGYYNADLPGYFRLEQSETQRIATEQVKLIEKAKEHKGAADVKAEVAGAAPITVHGIDPAQLAQAWRAQHMLHR